MSVLARYQSLFVRSLLARASSTGTTSSTVDDAGLDDLIHSLGKDSESQTRKNLPFATMLRHSKFMQLGDFDGRLVIGKIVRRIADDLYIDFGLKFYTVCKAPPVNSEAYVRGSRVLLKLHDVELSERFLGSKKDLTLLEADATLIRLLNSPALRTPRKEEATVDST